MTAEAVRPSPPFFPATPTEELDGALFDLRASAEAWTRVDIPRRIEHLGEVRRRMIDVAPLLAAEAAAAKGVSPELAGEDTVSGAITLLRTVRFLQHTLGVIERTGRVAFSPTHISTRAGGQVSLRVVPADAWDRILYRGWTAEVWLDPAVTRADLDASLGAIYTKPAPPTAGVALVLGAGNVFGIGPLDVIYKLFHEGHVALLKYNPVNSYAGPHFDYVFGELISEGFVRTAHGGAETGSYLTRHPQVDEIHITGAAHTHDAIVFGPGEEGAARKAANRPVLDKPITSELGNVGPVVIVPGVWSVRDLTLQAEHVATQMVQNAGFNCNAAKVIVLPAAWPQKDAFLDELRRVLRSLPNRPSYYPGAEERFERFRTSHPNVELLGERAPGIVPPSLLLGVDAEFEHLSFEEEAFCQIAATTELPGEDPASYLEVAVDFCNESLYGTLNATLLVDPQTQRELAMALERAVDRLRYGTVAINVWAAAGFVLGVTPWGAFPGHTQDDIQSGVGFVHNARLIDRPQKTVIRAPFRLLPRPPWSAFHPNSAAALQALAEFEAEPGWRRLSSVLAETLRG